MSGCQPGAEKLRYHCTSLQLVLKRHPTVLQCRRGSRKRCPISWCGCPPWAPTRQTTCGLGLARSPSSWTTSCAIFLLPFSCLANVMASDISHAACQMHDASVCNPRLKLLAVQQSGCVKYCVCVCVCVVSMVVLKHCSRWCRMDAPLAPKLCAGVLGRALLQGVLPAEAIPELCKPIEGGEVRRALVGPALQYVKVGKVNRTVLSGVADAIGVARVCSPRPCRACGVMPVCCHNTVWLPPTPEACGPA